MIVKIKVGDLYFKDFEMEENQGRHTGNTQLAYGHEAKGIILTNEENATVLSPKSTSGKINQILELMRFGDIEKKNIKIKVEF